MSDPSTTRRGVLSAAGTVLLAGCSGLDPSDDHETISAFRLREIVPDATEPVVVDTLPVEIERATLTTSAQRVDELLASVPIPFDHETLPNGHLRGRLIEAVDRATDHVAAARRAPSRFTALTELRSARSEARYAAAGWGFVDRQLTEADLRAQHQTVTSEMESFRQNVEYLGVDPAVAAAVYGRIEAYSETVLNDHRRVSDDSQLLTVADWGERVESAQAHLDDAKYLSEQFQSALPSGAGSVKSRLAAAGEQLIGRLRSLRDELPAESSRNNPEENPETAVQLRPHVRADAASSPRRTRVAAGPASRVLTATEGFTAFLAHNRLQTLIEEERWLRVETAADVQDARNRAVEAITTALRSSPQPALVRPILVRLWGEVAFADNRLANYDGDVDLPSLGTPLRQYLGVAVRARSVPTACRRVVDVLED